MPDIKKGSGTGYSTIYGTTGTIIIETAPIELMPHSVYLFIEMAVNWKKGAFWRNAGHVLQIDVDRSHQGLAFQEYSAQFPHVAGTLGFAGRPGGAAFYISTIDNTQNHGPGSQGSTKGEADSCFGRVIEGDTTVQRLFNTWGKKQNGFAINAAGFTDDKSEHAQITLSLMPVGK